MIPQSFYYPNEHAHLWADIPSLLVTRGGALDLAPEPRPAPGLRCHVRPIRPSSTSSSSAAGSAAASWPIDSRSPGKRVLVLERGPWRDSLPVRSMGIERRAPFPYGSKAVTHLLHSLQLGPLRLRLNRAGLYELFAFRGINALVASGVGGGSLAYGGLLEPPRNPRFWQGRHPQLDPAGIERYYDKVIADMGGVRLSREHPLPQSVWTQLPDAPAASLPAGGTAAAHGAAAPALARRGRPVRHARARASSGNTARSTATASWARWAVPRRRWISSTSRPCSARAPRCATCAR